MNATLKLKFIVMSVSFLVCLSQCRKDPGLVSEYCHTDDRLNESHRTFENVGSSYYKPQFDSDFLYVQLDEQNSDHVLKVDLKTNESRKMVTSTHVRDFDVRNGNTVLLDGNFNQFYFNGEIKPFKVLYLGSDIDFLTDSLLIFNVTSETFPGAGGIKICDLSGNVLDSLTPSETLNSVPSEISVISSEKILAVISSNYTGTRTIGIYEINLITKTYSVYFEEESFSDVIYDVKKVGNDIYFTSSHLGIVKIDENLNLKSVISVCDSVSYRKFDNSDNGDKLYCERIRFSIPNPDNGRIEVKSDIVEVGLESQRLSPIMVN